MRDESLGEAAGQAAQRARLTFRRLAGLDRSGPPPPQTLRGQPWHVWTVPNAIGFARLALIPIFIALALGKPGSHELAGAEGLYRELRAIGLAVLLDDRAAGPGAKFADAELLGIPLRLTVGRRSLESGRAEAQRRRGLEDIEGGVPLEGAAEAVAELWRTLP